MLQDNRHYTSYIHQKKFLRHPGSKEILYPKYHFLHQLSRTDNNNYFYW
ncbi:MAG: hypothetical protein IKZ76_01450 [Lachnospiraceae bacterium]|nr:hypothetical protein [Lachnospiraceae bacterium]